MEEYFRQRDNFESFDAYRPIVLVPNIIFSDAENFNFLTGYDIDDSKIGRSGPRRKKPITELRAIFNGDGFSFISDVSLNQLASYKINEASKRLDFERQNEAAQIKLLDELNKAALSQLDGAASVLVYRKKQDLNQRRSNHEPRREFASSSTDYERKICTSALANDIRINGALMTSSMKNWLGAENLKILKFYQNINEAYKDMQTGNCAVIIDYPQKIQSIYKALEKESAFVTELGPVIPFEIVKDPYAKNAGFADWVALDLANRIRKGNTSNEQILTLRKFGISNINDFDNAAQRMIKLEYDVDPEPSAARLIAFLNDEIEAKKQGKSVKNLLVSRQKEGQIAAEDHLRKFPFEAILTCGVPRHLNIHACFSGNRYSPDTELVISSDNSQAMYKPFNLRSAGTQKSDGMYIYLTNKYYIRAQNSNNSLILGLKIINRKTNRVIFEDQAAQFDVIESRR
jgi:hypothetical protein